MAGGRGGPGDAGRPGGRGESVHRAGRVTGRPALRRRGRGAIWLPASAPLLRLHPRGAGPLLLLLRHCHCLCAIDRRQATVALAPTAPARLQQSARKPGACGAGTNDGLGGIGQRAGRGLGTGEAWQGGHCGVSARAPCCAAVHAAPRGPLRCQTTRLSPSPRQGGPGGRVGSALRRSAAFPGRDATPYRRCTEKIITFALKVELSPMAQRSRSPSCARSCPDSPAAAHTGGPGNTWLAASRRES